MSLEELLQDGSDVPAPVQLEKSHREDFAAESITDGERLAAFEISGAPAFRSTPKQLVLYRDRLASLAAAEHQVLREELQALLTQLSAVGAAEALQPISTGA